MAMSVETMEFEDLVSQDQFLLVEGPPNTMGRSTRIADPLSRLGRLLFSRPIDSHHLEIAERMRRKITSIHEAAFYPLSSTLCGSGSQRSEAGLGSDPEADPGIRGFGNP